MRPAAGRGDLRSAERRGQETRAERAETGGAAGSGDPRRALFRGGPAAPLSPVRVYMRAWREKTAGERGRR
jgi:hypothetical protein